MKTKVIEIISSLSFVDFKTIHGDDLLRHIGFDSFKTVELIIAMEDHFNIVFDDSDLDLSKLKTVNDIVELVKKTMN